MTNAGHPLRQHLAFAILAALLLLPAGCRPRWEAIVVGPDGARTTVDREQIAAWAELSGEGEEAVPPDRALAASGYRLVASVTLTCTDGTRHALDWAAVPDGARWSAGGPLDLGEVACAPAELRAAPAADRLAEVQMEITDVAPTAAGALGLSAPAQATGHPRTTAPARHVLILFLDSFGYVRYTEALAEGLIPNLAELGEPLLGLTTYPPVTASASASLLTGAPPKVHGATSRRTRSTEAQTLFDVVAEAGMRGVAVEGDALSFNLRSADVTLSGDRNADGSTDDEVLANALAAIDAGMPELLWIHFHGIDDAGHTYGPGAPEEEETIRRVDAAVGEILAALPPGTLVVIVADHGMHAVTEAGRLGNHGRLIERDVLIPIFVRTLDF